jgi:hypothetical protein
MPQELVFHAIKVMKSSRDNVSCQLQFKPKIWDVKLGIGISKSASPAQTDGPSTPRVSAFQFLTTVTLGKLQEPAPHAIRDMN